MLTIAPIIIARVKSTVGNSPHFASYTANTINTTNKISVTIKIANLSARNSGCKAKISHCVKIGNKYAQDSIKNATAKLISDKKSATPISLWQLRHRPRKNNHEKIGILSYHLIRFLQCIHTDHCPKSFFFTA